MAFPAIAAAEEPALEALCDEAATLIEQHAGQCAALASALDEAIDEHEGLLRETLPTLDLSGSTARHCRQRVNAVVKDPESGNLIPKHLICLAHPDIRSVISRLKDIRRGE